MHARARVAVAGATGRVGRHVVDVLEEQGHEVVPIARSVGVDVITTEGLAEALEGVESVIDAATGPSRRSSRPPSSSPPPRGTFSSSASGGRTAHQRRVDHRDRPLTSGYGVAKQAHEQATLAGPVPAQILRAAQFHEFVPQLMDWGRQNGVVYVPKMRTQLVAARTVAEALADLAVAPESACASTPIPEIAGPREENLAEMARLYASHQRRPGSDRGGRQPRRS